MAGNIGLQDPGDFEDLSPADMALIERRNQRDLRGTAEQEIANTPGGIDPFPQPDMQAGDATGGGRGGSLASRELLKAILAASPQDRVPKPGEPTVKITTPGGANVLIPKRTFDAASAKLTGAPTLSDKDRAALSAPPDSHPIIDWGMGVMKDPTIGRDDHGVSDEDFVAQQRAANAAAAAPQPAPGQPRSDTIPAQVTKTVMGANASGGARGPGTSDFDKATQEQVAAVNQAATVGQAKAVEQAAYAQKAADEAQRMQVEQAEKQRQRQQFMDAQMAKVQKMQDAFDSGTVDPNHFYGSLSTPQKITAGLGVMLGAIGGALTGSPNEALGIIQKSIDRDIEAQKTNLAKKAQGIEGQRTMLGMYRAQFGDDAAADAATRATMLQNAAMQADAAAAKFGSPEVKAKAAQAAAALHQEAAKAKAEFAQRAQELAIKATEAQSMIEKNSLDRAIAMAQLKGGGKGAGPVDAALEAAQRLKADYDKHIASNPGSSLKQFFGGTESARYKDALQAFGPLIAQGLKGSQRGAPDGAELEAYMDRLPGASTRSGPAKNKFDAVINALLARKMAGAGAPDTAGLDLQEE